jgi:hypothetical protein
MIIRMRIIVSVEQANINGEMKMHQSMSGQAAQKKIDVQAQKYAKLIADEGWTLEYAHKVLANGALDLFEISGLAKAIACFQCEAELVE